MAISIASISPARAWHQIANEIICAEPLEALDRLATEALAADERGDVEAHLGLCANVLTYMVLDWARFTDWGAWVARFDAANAQTPTGQENNLRLARATGAVIVALLRGDEFAVMRPLGEQLEALTAQAASPVQVALAAVALLPWMQMSRNVSGAENLKGILDANAAHLSLDQVGARYLRGVWVVDWAQHTSVTDQSRFPEAVAGISAYLDQYPMPGLQFRRARWIAERCLGRRDIAGTIAAHRDMLAALHPSRPMDSATYNGQLISLACVMGDAERAMLHVGHLLRDLDRADCPPSLATVFRMLEARAYLAAGDYEKSALVYEACVEQAHTTHADVYRGSASFARALQWHQQEPASSAPLREHLGAALAMSRRRAQPNFLFAQPTARGMIGALALRENIEADFVRASLLQFPVPPPNWADEHWPWALTLRCFGGFRTNGLMPEGKGASRASNKPLSLLMLVAASGAQGLPVAVAADALWPGQDGDQAENALSVTLLRLRRLYDEADLIERRGGWLHLNANRVWTDVASFEAHLHAMPERSAVLSETTRLQYINRFFDLYRGDCLLSIEDDWARQRASHYRGRITLASQRMLQDALQANCYAAAELTMTRVFERGLDASRLLAAVHPSERSTPAWRQLQQCVEALQNA